MADSIHWYGVKEIKNINCRLGRDLWHKYAQGYDINEYNRMLIMEKMLANLNLSFNINLKSPLIIYKL